MKTVSAYILGFSMTFTVIAGGMYFLSSRYPWMFGNQGTQQSEEKLKPSASIPSVPGGVDVASTQGDSVRENNETVNTLRQMLAAKNDSIRTKDDSISALNTQLTQLRKKTSDDKGVISQLQSQVNSWTSQTKKDMASTYNDLDPASAAKIMRNLDDNDVIFILSSVQKKQAAKILSELDPARAAKLMTSIGKPTK